MKLVIAILLLILFSGCISESRVSTLPVNQTNQIQGNRFVLCYNSPDSGSPHDVIYDKVANVTCWTKYGFGTSCLEGDFCG